MYIHIFNYQFIIQVFNNDYKICITGYIYIYVIYIFIYLYPLILCTYPVIYKSNYKLIIWINKWTC